MRRPALAALALLAVVLGVLTACSNTPVESSAGSAPTAAASAPAAAPTVDPSTQPFNLVGSMTLADNWEAGPGGLGCEGNGGYSDMQPGGSVTVQDASGTVIALGSLTIGVAAGTECQLYFTVDDVPASPFYQIEVTNRGLVTFTAEQARGGEVMLSLG